MSKRLFAILMSLMLAAAMMVSCGAVKNERHDTQKSSDSESEADEDEEVDEDDRPAWKSRSEEYKNKRKHTATTTTTTVTTTVTATVTTVPVTEPPTEPPTDPPPPPEPEPVPEPEPEPIQLSYKERNSLSAQDFVSYVYGNTVYDSEKDNDDHRFYDINIANADSSVIEEYIDLLVSSYNFEVTNEYVLDVYSRDSYYRFLRFNGGDVSTFQYDTYSRCGLVDTDLFVFYYQSGSSLRIELKVAYGLDYDDYGDRSSYVPPPEPVIDDGGSSGGGSSGDWSGYDNGGDDFRPEYKVMCSKCHGSGTIACTQCDGRGYMNSYIQTPNYSGSLYPNNSYNSGDKCMKCHGTGELTCPDCDGNGKKTVYGG